METQLKRSPMPRKRKTPRRTLSPRCSVGRCKQIARVEGFCKSHAQREADRLFSLWVRETDGRCLNCGSEEWLQAAHVVSRRYHATRWMPANCMALCRVCHTRQTHHPLEGERMFDTIMAEHPMRFPLDVATLKLHALSAEPPDLADVLRDLRTKVAA